VKVPTPGITCKIDVINDPLEDCGAADAGSGAVTIIVDSKTSINAMKIATLFRCFILFCPPSARRSGGMSFAASGHNSKKAS
jgi:hypothetical protein